MHEELSCRKAKVDFYFCVKVHFLRAALLSGAKGPLAGEKEIQEILNKEVRLNV